MGRAATKGQNCQRLMSESVVVVCSPKLAEVYGEIKAPSDLARIPLIHDDAPERDPSCPTWARPFAPFLYML